jgi:predicted heme/steroid binding protein
MKKWIVILIILSVVTFATINVKVKNAEQNTTPSATTSINEQIIEKTFTIEELKQYNGKNGEKAYIAVDGRVYDVTDVKAWSGGRHKGNQAGQDVTNMIKFSPHGNSVLKKLTQIGILVEEEIEEEKE